MEKDQKLNEIFQIAIDQALTSLDQWLSEKTYDIEDQWEEYKSYKLGIDPDIGSDDIILKFFSTMMVPETYALSDNAIINEDSIRKLSGFNKLIEVCGENDLGLELSALPNDREILAVEFTLKPDKSFEHSCIFGSYYTNISTITPDHRPGNKINK